VALLLEVEHLNVGYGAVPVVRDLSITVEPGEIVALLGANGAGKTTTLLGLSGCIPIQSGTIRMFGLPTNGPLNRRVKAGLGFVPEGRSIFPNLTTRQNLRVGGISPDAAFEHFPELAKRIDVRAGLLSGGEQQMLTVGRALARKSPLLLVDELSLGLAPMVVTRLLNAIRVAADTGVGVILVEQHVRRILDVADSVCLLHRGRVEMAGSAQALRPRLEEIENSYFGTNTKEMVPEVADNTGSCIASTAD
jgi:ABC-type branched-subunit amino acid transport system ATPase component